MKKTLSLAALLALSTSAFAGFNDGSTAVTSVAQALKARDNTPVSLTGVIVERAGNDDDEFIFRDNTGDIVIEVEDEAWNGQEVRPNDRITIEGKVDSETFRKSTIDVHHIRKM